MILGLLAACGGPAPGPPSSLTSDLALHDELREATDKASLERYEEFLEANDKGEDHEHITLFQQRIDAGELSVRELFDVGDSVFEHRFRRQDGYGDAELPRFRRIHQGDYGGLDGFSCGACHFQGGPDGGGGLPQGAYFSGNGTDTERALLRTAPHVLGLGYVQQLAAEMTADLQRQRDGGEGVVALQSKGVSFGTLVVGPDGQVDTSGVVGVDPDLVVRPFGWKGHTATLRRMGEGAARLHLGIQSHPLVEAAKNAPDAARLGSGSEWWDPDGDGVSRELEEGSLTALAVYLALLEMPVVIAPGDSQMFERWQRGEAVFGEVGCAECHRPTLKVTSIYWDEQPDSPGSEAVRIHLNKDGDPPRIHYTNQVPLFSDLRRHDMGPGLADPADDPDGIGRSIWLTRPLWGLAETAPYLHDGRAATIPEAIAAHDGEGAGARDAFAALPPDDRVALHVFLLSLSRTPRLAVSP